MSKIIKREDKEKEDNKGLKEALDLFQRGSSKILKWNPNLGVYPKEETLKVDIENLDAFEILRQVPELSELKKLDPRSESVNIDPLFEIGFMSLLSKIIKSFPPESSSKEETQLISRLKKLYEDFKNSDKEAMNENILELIEKTDASTVPLIVKHFLVLVIELYL